MKKKIILFFGLIITFMIVSFIYISHTLLIRNNVHEIAGIKCARNLRVTVNYPFCSTVLDCMEDCSTVKGGFVEAKTIAGFGEQDRCFCYTKNGIENIW